MSRQTLAGKLDLACRIAKSCFDRSMGSGTTGNLSFMHNGYIFITAGGTCFGFLTADDFAAVPYKADGSDQLFSESEKEYLQAAMVKKPSKELPLHKLVYDRLMKDGSKDGAVIHTHATYSVLWSCIPDLDQDNCVPEITPYLRMKMGPCGLIPYEKPGSPELFAAFEQGCKDHYGWILTRHGLVCGGKDLMEAFSRSEELEETCKIAWMVRNAGLL